MHSAGRCHRLEISAPRGQSWGACVVEHLQSSSARKCPVVLVSARHHHELRGDARQPGLLAEADGGILVIDVGALSSESWLACAEALLASHSRGRDKDGLPTGPSRPARVSAVLIGPELELRKFRERHPEAGRLFARRLLADVDVPRDAEGVALLASVLSQEAADLGLKGITLTGLAHLIEEAAGGRSRRGRLSTELDTLIQALGEAGSRGRSKVSKPGLVEALKSIRSRREGAEDYARIRLDEKLLAIECAGSTVGLVNGLMVYGASRQAFSMPGRISARVSAGREGIINIEREAKYSGSSFDKGVFQLSAWLRGHFGYRKQLSFAATLAFEQSSSKVDGNSATIAEALAVLSALSGLPAHQGIAVSGALNQRGEVLPIGSVNLKVEGWWKTCQIEGMTGRQGVLIPSRNVGDLQLPEALVADIRNGRFHLWAAQTIEDAIEVVLGRKAGQPLKAGGWTKGSVYQRSAAHLAALGPQEKKPSNRKLGKKTADQKKSTRTRTVQN